MYGYSYNKDNERIKRYHIFEQFYLVRENRKGNNMLAVRYTQNTNKILIDLESVN